MPSNILVTGGAGFIGSHVADELIRQGNAVVVLDDLSGGLKDNVNPKATFITGSITDEKLIEKMFHERHFDYVFHLAALPRLKRSLDDPWETHKVNVDGTLNLLLMAKKYKVKRFVFASSSSIYGNPLMVPFFEDMRPNPLVPYSLQKLECEEYCKMFSDLWGLSTISLRYFNVYGSRMNPNSPYALLLPKFIKLMSQNRQPTINGDGKHSRDFTYITDVVDATLLGAKSKISGEVFNIGRGETISVNKVVEILNGLLGKRIKPIHGPPVIEPGITWASNAKARKLLGWKPRVKFEEGLRTML